MTAPRACAYCHAVIVRPATRWVHKDTERRTCGNGTGQTAFPKPRPRSEIARDPKWRHALALRTGKDLLS